MAQPEPIPTPRSRGLRSWSGRARTLAAASLVLVAWGCSEPRTGSVRLPEGLEAAATLLDEAKAALPRYEQRDVTINDSKPCRKTFAGYAVGTTGGRQAEKAFIGWLDPGVPAEQGMRQVVGLWRAKGYEVRTLESRADDGRFPKVVARTGDYEITVVAFRDRFTDQQGRQRAQVTLYARSDCLEP